MGNILRTKVIGRTGNNLVINSFFFGDSDPSALIIGGVHGDEKEGVALSYALLAEFARSYPYKFGLAIIPCLNLDGFLDNIRQNSNGVDLNRNLPTKDWSEDYKLERFYPGISPNSESENIALVNFIENNPLIFIMSLHSYKKELLNINGDCGPIDIFLNKELGISLKRDMGYPTPGCLGTFAGLEKNIPTITYELLRDSEIAHIRRRHMLPIVEAFKLLDNHL